MGHPPKCRALRDVEYRRTVGYFKRKVDRGRSRELVRRLESESSRSPETGPAWESVPARPPRAQCYLRFACTDFDPHSGRRTGIFTAAYDVVARPQLDAVSRAALKSTIRWFEKNVPAPRSVDNAAAIFLFKSGAGACTRRIWDLVRVLDENGIRCAMQVFRDPGLIVQEDEFQVAVIPRSGPSSL